MRSSNDTLRGFTLVELAITILILGMLIAMGIPAIRNMSQTQMLKANAENLAAQLRMARQRAISLDSDQTLHFMANTFNCDYHLHNGGSPALPLGSLANGISYYLGAGTSQIFVMKKDGTCNQSALIILQNTRGLMDTVSVQVSGLVLTN